MEMVSTITTLISNVVTFAGGLLLLFGAVTLGTNLKDHAGGVGADGCWLDAAYCEHRGQHHCGSAVYRAVRLQCDGIAVHSHTLLSGAARYCGELPQILPRG